MIACQHDNMASTTGNESEAFSIPDVAIVSSQSDMLSPSQGVYNEVGKTRFAFLDFPPEVRNTIYRLVLVADSVDSTPVKYIPEGGVLPIGADGFYPHTEKFPGRPWYYCLNTGDAFVVTNDTASKTTLAQPALTNTSSQIRAEALPIYCGENHFRLAIPPDDRSDCEDEWYRFVKMIRVFSRGGTGGKGTSWLRFICRISADHVLVSLGWEDANSPYPNLPVERRHAIDFKSVLLTARGDAATRVGDNDLDWKEHSAVKEAFRKSLKTRWQFHKSVSLDKPGTCGPHHGCAVHYSEEVSKGSGVDRGDLPVSR